MNKTINLLNTFILLFLVSINVFSQTLDAFNYKIQKSSKGKNGMVVSAHPLASKVGIMMLKEGGNAVDAIIATQLALAVVYPIAGNIGGGGFFILRNKNGEVVVLDYREVAPNLANMKMYLDKNGNKIPNLSVEGHLASGIPGTISGLFASMKYAKLPFEKLIQPAIDLAKNGFALSKNEADNLNDNAEIFRRNNKHNEVPFLNKNKWKEGDTLIQLNLANTLEIIKTEGEKAFYEGKIAKLIIEEMKRGKGIINLKDLKQYKTSILSPLVFTYKDKYKVITMPPPSSGGFVLNQVLKMIELNPVPDYSLHSTNALNIMIEAEKLSFADRAKYIGDPAFIKIPLKQLLDTTYLKNRIKNNFILGKAKPSEKINAGIVKEKFHTTHLSAADKEGNVVVVTTTLNNNYGSSVVVKGAGFILNDEMDDFNTKIGESNIYGAVGEEKNTIQPRKKMLSSMSPTIVLRNDSFYFSVGSPGGTRIPTSVIQTIVNIIDFNQSTENAINTPRFHHQWKPDEVLIERDMKQEEIQAIEKLGYKIKLRGGMGKVEVIKYENEEYEGVGDKRGDDSAESY